MTVTHLTLQLWPHHLVVNEISKEGNVLRGEWRTEDQTVNSTHDEAPTFRVRQEKSSEQAQLVRLSAAFSDHMHRLLMCILGTCSMFLLVPSVSLGYKFFNFFYPT